MSATDNNLAFRSGRPVMFIRAGLLLLGIAFIALCFSDDERIAGGPGFGITELLLLGVGIVNVLAALLGGGIMMAWLVAQVSLVVALGAAEVALHATVAPRYQSPFQLDERYLYELVPGVLREHRHMEVNGGTQLYRVNSLGFRGEEFSPERSDAKRVIIYGDSFIHAEYTALEDTLAEQLEGRLTKQLGADVEVINGGVAGYGPDQVLRRVEAELKWLQPDLLVVGIFTGNDFGDLLRNKLYRLDDNGGLVENAYTLSDEIKLNAKLEISDPLLRKVGREAKGHMQWLLAGAQPPKPDPEQRTEDRLEQHIREYREYIVESDNVVRDLRTDPYSADISLRPDSESARYKIELMAAVIAGIRRQAEVAGVPLLLIAIPHPMDIMDGNHPSGIVNRERHPGYLPTQLTDSVAAIATRQGIDHINLFPDFQSVADPAALYLQGGDDHWNNAGQALAADIIAARILERNYLKPK